MKSAALCEKIQEDNLLSIIDENLEITSLPLESNLVKHVKKMVGMLSNEDEETLHKIRSILKEKILVTRLTKIFEEKKITYPLAKTFIKNQLINSPQPLEEKVKFLKALQTPSSLIQKSIFQKDTNSLLQLDDILSSVFTKNTFYKEIKQDLIKLRPRSQNTGALELFLLLFGNNTVEGKSKDAKKGDVSIDGHVIEIKVGGAISPKTKKGISVGVLNNEMFATLFPDTDPQSQMKIIKQKKSGYIAFNVNKLSEWFMTTKIPKARHYKIIENYFTQLYADKPNNVKLAKDIYKSIKNPEKLAKILMRYVIGLYKLNDKWDSLISYNVANDSFINIVNPENINFSLIRRMGISLQRGKSTYAVSDGSVWFSV